MTNDQPLIFDEILEEEEEDKILENEILENDRVLENPPMTRKVGKSKNGNPSESGRDLESQSIDKEVGNSKRWRSKCQKSTAQPSGKESREASRVHLEFLAILSSWGSNS